jgi:hypothetical protein
MNFWPCESFDVQTSMSEEEVVGSIRSNIEPRRFFRFGSNHKCFQGVINNNGFKISRIIHYRNSFLPLIVGSFRRGRDGMIVSINLALNPFTRTFMGVWFTMVALGLFGGVGSLLGGNIRDLPMFLIPCGMLVFGWVMVLAGFWLEARKQKVMLIEMFKKV